MIKKLILKICDITELTPYEVVESFLQGSITAILSMASVYPFFWSIVKIAEIVGLR